MKKIMNGKIYNTETSNLIGTFCYGIPGDFDYFEESLYQKRTGEFFLHGSGGANTKYAVSLKNGNWSGGESIFSLSWDSAKSWAEKHLTSDEYESAFGEIADDSTHTVITLSLSTYAVEKIKREAAKNGVSISSYIESLIQ